jgi:hypothetical protein
MNSQGGITASESYKYVTDYTFWNDIFFISYAHFNKIINSFHIDIKDEEGFESLIIPQSNMLMFVPFLKSSSLLK